MDDIREQLNAVLVKIFNTIMFYEEKQLCERGKCDFSIKDVHIIEAIYEKEKENASTAGNISKSLNITPGTLTVAIDRLEKRGYILRKKNASDKRRTSLHLTDKALKINEQHKKFHSEMIETVVEKLSLSEEELMIELLSKITAFFAQDDKK